MFISMVTFYRVAKMSLSPTPKNYTKLGQLFVYFIITCLLSANSRLLQVQVLGNHVGAHGHVLRPVSLESVDCLLPLLLPGVEVPVERPDELHPPLHSGETQGRLNSLVPLGGKSQADPFELHLNI